MSADESIVYLIESGCDCFSVRPAAIGFRVEIQEGGTTYCGIGSTLARALKIAEDTRRKVRVAGSDT